MKIMNQILGQCVLLLSMVACIHGETLGVLHEKPWLGFWVGYETTKWDSGVNSKGQGAIYLKNSGDRLGHTRSIPLHYVLEEKIKGKWVKRRILEDGFETEQEPTDKPKKIEWVMTYTGGGQARFKQEFSGRGMRIAAELLKKSEEASEARVSIRMAWPTFFRTPKKKRADEEYLKDNLKGEKVKLVLNNNERLSLKTYEVGFSLATPEINDSGAQSFELKSKINGNRTVAMSLGRPKSGKILFEQDGAFYLGFRVVWYPEPSEAGAFLNLFIK